MMIIIHVIHRSSEGVSGSSWPVVGDGSETQMISL